ncbi:hypothetical protein GCM10007049_20560 [Echinicola pacifica]|uniref:DUF1573 domain-containing protein n=1 Tax=Echinicola pacifica TaxID=346377 RepID=A0A918PYQ4_9BACT|nr:DUF1573 domain-containing protein [Echinicola pacifica]GGZ27610.1 hypothetical protein GCM10007049_20560 [Echinicola pacifica]
MKKLILLAVVALVAFASQVRAQETSVKSEVKEAVKGPVITFVETEKDFGEISQGTKVEHTFKFTNTGTEVLKISNVAATCGCTVPSWPKEPIAPGKTGEIKVSFNSTGKMGKQRSVVRIYSNASEPIEKVALISNVTKETR